MRIDVAIQVIVWASNIRENVFSDTTAITFTRRYNKEMSIRVQHEGRNHCVH
jgi:hypothetical protein